MTTHEQSEEKLKHKVFLITGASGNVGSAVLKHLRSHHNHGSESKIHVRIGARNPSNMDLKTKTDDAMDMDVNVVKLDFEDSSTFQGALKDVDRLFLVRPPHISDVSSTLNAFISCAEDLGVEHIVFLSVRGAENQPRIPHYKIEQHLMASNFKLKYTLLRAGFFFQNLEGAYLPDIRSRGQVRVPAGNGRVAFIDADDLGAIGAKCLLDGPDKHKKAYNLSGSKAITFTEVADALSKELGRNITYPPVSWFPYFISLVGRMPIGQAVITTWLSVSLRSAESEASKVDDGTVSGLLGRPPVEIGEYVRRNRHVFIDS